MATSDMIMEPPADTTAARTRQANDDLDAQGPAADLVRVYLNGIGRTQLLTAAQEVELAKRIEAGVFAQYKLETEKRLSTRKRADLKLVVRDGNRARSHLLVANCGWSSRWPSATPVAACRCWISSRKATWA